MSSLSTIINDLFPQPQRRLTNLHHFVCCGKFHVKFATSVIILIKLLLTIFFSIYMITGHYYINYWLDVFYDTIEMLSLIALIVGYLSHDPKWMWPYMAVEFTWLIIALIVYSVSISAIISPQKFYDWILSKKSITSTDIRNEAYATAFNALVYSLFVSLELSILLACNRYFDDEKERKKHNLSNPIILNVDQQQFNQSKNIQSTVEMESLDKLQSSSTTATTVSSTIPTTASTTAKQQNQNGFENPNFSITNSDDENDNNFDQKSKSANVIA